MKNTIRLCVLTLAVSGAVAGIFSSQTAKSQQVAALSHQVIFSAMPAPICGPSTCNIRGGK